MTRTSRLDQQQSEVRRVDGGTIAVSGSPGLVRSLLELDLLDELQLLIHPVVAGESRKRLFADDAALRRLALISAQSTSSGVVIAHYRPVR